jgi:hypothetical protein
MTVPPLPLVGLRAEGELRVEIEAYPVDGLVVGWAYSLPDVQRQHGSAAPLVGQSLGHWRAAEKLSIHFSTLNDQLAEPESAKLSVQPGCPAIR